nr:TIM barrel protein [Bifidobacterium commune]
MVSVHLKDAKPVTATSKGQFRDVPFGDGTVDFEGCLRTLHRLGYTSAMTIEMWANKSAKLIEEVKNVKAFFDKIFRNVGIQQKPLD